MEHDQHFTGTINRSAADSTIVWIPGPSHLTRKPNIVLIVLDDVGYAEFGCYGSDIETPTLDSLATDGLRYANFHVTHRCACFWTSACLRVSPPISTPMAFISPSIHATSASSAPPTT